MGNGHKPDGRKQGKQGNPPRKHHYVPAFYQRKFTNEYGLLWVYDRALQTYKELPPEVVCLKKDLYSIRSNDGSVDTKIETKILSIVDRLAADAIRRLEDGKDLDRDAFDAFSFFAAFQYLRLPSIDRDVRQTYANAIEEVARVSFSSVERAKAVMEAYAEESGEVSSVTPESMVEAVQGKHLKFEATEAPFLSNMLQQAVTLSRVIGHLN